MIWSIRLNYHECGIVIQRCRTEFKLIVKRENNDFVWEETPNREVCLEVKHGNVGGDWCCPTEGHRASSYLCWTTFWMGTWEPMGQCSNQALYLLVGVHPIQLLHVWHVCPIWLHSSKSSLFWPPINQEKFTCVPLMWETATWPQTKGMDMHGNAWLKQRKREEGRL